MQLLLCCCAILLICAACSPLDTARDARGETAVEQWGHEHRLPYGQASPFKGLVLFCRTTVIYYIILYYIILYYIILYYIILYCIIIYYIHIYIDISKTSYTACHQNLCPQKVASIALKFCTRHLREILKRMTWPYFAMSFCTLSKLAGWRSSSG